MADALSDSNAKRLARLAVAGTRIRSAISHLQVATGDPKTDDVLDCAIRYAREAERRVELDLAALMAEME